MAERKRRRSEPPVTARLPTIDTVVASPWLPGKTDRVERVLDTVLALRRAGRISLAEHRAAERYRDAYDAVRGGLGCSINPDKAVRGSSVSHTPAPATLVAAQVLKRATDALSRSGSPVVVEMVVGQGYTIEDAARSLFGAGPDGKADRASREAVGVFLRRGLRVLAELWR